MAVVAITQDEARHVIVTFTVMSKDALQPWTAGDRTISESNRIFAGSSIYL